MSDASEDAELSKLHQAAKFLRAVRLAASGKAQTGGNHLTPAQEQAITVALGSSAFVSAVKESAQTDLPVNHLVERFEEMCRRQGATTPVALRKPVAKLLAAELWVNHRALNVSAKRLVAATLHEGAIAPELLKEFAEYAPYVVTAAMTQSPAAPRSFLQRLKKQVEEVSTEPEFANTAPSEIVHTALNFSSHLRSRLRRNHVAGI